MQGVGTKENGEHRRKVGGEEAELKVQKEKGPQNTIAYSNFAFDSF